MKFLMKAGFSSWVRVLVFLTLSIGAFALALTLYYVYVVYDIVVTKKARKIQPMTLTYLGWWKNLFLRVKKFYYGLRVKTAKQK